MQIEVSEGEGRYRRLVDLSRNNHYNVFDLFEWPDELPSDELWMSRDLLSVSGTVYEEELTEDQLLAISKWESINFYSLSMYGERDLTQVVIKYMHTEEFNDESEYFHHFVEEENKHMWLFSQFCKRYGGKIYPNKNLKFKGFEQEDINTFNAFAKIMLFEELGDYFNRALKNDKNIHPFIRSLNKQHHIDESRHLAMARILLKKKHADLREKYPDSCIDKIESYLKSYIVSSIELLYNPSVYVDSGIKNPYEFRRRILADLATQDKCKKIMGRVVKFFIESNIFKSEEIYS